MATWRKWWALMLAVLCLTAQLGLVSQGHYCGDELVAEAFALHANALTAAQWEADCCGTPQGAEMQPLSDGHQDITTPLKDPCCNNKAKLYRADTDGFSTPPSWHMAAAGYWVGILTGVEGSVLPIPLWVVMPLAPDRLLQSDRAPPDQKGRKRYLYFHQLRMGDLGLYATAAA